MPGTSGGTRAVLRGHHMADRVSLLKGYTKTRSVPELYEFPPIQSEVRHEMGRYAWSNYHRKARWISLTARSRVTLTTTSIFVVVGNAYNATVHLLPEFPPRLGQFRSKSFARAKVGSNVPDLELCFRSGCGESKGIIWRPGRREDLPL